MNEFPLVNLFRRRIYGPNLIDVPVKPYMRLLFEEVNWGDDSSSACVSFAPNHALFDLLGSEPLLRVPVLQHHPVDRGRLLLLRCVYSAHLVLVYRHLAVRDPEGGPHSRDVLHPFAVKWGCCASCAQPVRLRSKASPFETWPGSSPTSQCVETREVRSNMCFAFSFENFLSPENN